MGQTEAGMVAIHRNPISEEPKMDALHRNPVSDEVRVTIVEKRQRGTEPEVFTFYQESPKFMLDQWCPGNSSLGFICIIEDISPAWAAALSDAWQIEQSFFDSYFDCPQKTLPAIMRHRMPAPHKAWRESARYSDGRMPGQSDVNTQSYHVTGYVPYLAPQQHSKRHLRPLERDAELSMTNDQRWTSGLRMSYYRSIRRDHDFYLFLVDAPLIQEDRLKPDADRELRPSKLSWWVPCASNRRGLPIAQAYDMEHRLCLRRMLATFTSYSNNYGSLFAGDAAMDPSVLCHFFAASSYWSAYEYLNSRIKNISFGKLRSANNPGVEDIDRLHELREHVNTLDVTISRVRDYIYPGIEDIQAAYSRKKFRVQADDTVEHVRRLDSVVMNTLPLITASLTASEAREAKLLTRLAAIYLPLSLVTSIFGMNVTEINGSAPPAWAVVVALAIIWLLTLLLIGTGTSAQREKLYGWKYLIRYTVLSRYWWTKKRLSPDEESAVELRRKLSMPIE